MENRAARFSYRPHRNYRNYLDSLAFLGQDVAASKRFLKMNYVDNNWAVAIAVANEEQDFPPFYAALCKVLDRLASGKVYFIVDKVSKDATLEVCQRCSAKDSRFVTVWAPENRNIADAYRRGLRVALENGHNIIIEMDAGMSHDPNAIPMFLRVLSEGNDCAFGSRYINGGSNLGSPLKRRFFSRIGTILARMFLGASLKDMTSGFQGFRSHIVEKLLATEMKSTAHFYQTEVRYLLRNYRTIEVPIHYRAPSPRVSQKAINNALETLGYYTWLRFTFRGPSL
jgi:dolichol-phosphate mannosyltransferase